MSGETRSPGHAPPEEGAGRTERLIREERLELIQELAPIGIARLDLDGVFMDVNDALCRTVGRSEDDLVGRTFQEITHPEDLDADLAYVQQLLSGEIDSYQMEKRYRHAEGHDVWVHLTGAILRHPVDGRPLEFVAHIRDITEERDSRALLERTVRKRTAEFHSANEELEAFAYSVSHDLRAPLRALSGFAQALREDYGHLLDDEPEAEDFLRRIEANSVRMGRLIDDILKLSRVSRRSMERDRVDLADLAREIVRERRTAEPERDVEVEIPESLPAFCDGSLLRVLLQNLIGNAWKFTRGTEGARIEVGVTSRSDGERLYFVRDNGAGFDMEYADKLFRAFQRLHRESEFEGTGIGLATVARIARRHGGSVQAEGAVGKGATFFFGLGDEDL